jgi:FtsH-binding integral membrane protein
VTRTTSIVWVLVSAVLAVVLLVRFGANTKSGWVVLFLPFGVPALFGGTGGLVLGVRLKQIILMAAAVTALVLGVFIVMIISLARSGVFQ